ncbi:MAG: hypothetical protein K6C98_07055 [Treponema sp.]|nr:hypothetical protein [Treponema sp.]
MKKSLIVLLMFVITLPCFAAKAKKSKKTSKAKIEVTEDVISDDTEIITREQIDTMFSLANQLNADIQTAIEDSEAGLDEIIAEEKILLDKMLPSLKRSSEWTNEDAERLKAINAEYKSLSKKYKP